MKPFHPFPARMAHELALSNLENLDTGATVLDPMAGSGTVLRHAINFGCKAIGLDLDPLAVLMSQVSTSKYDPEKFLKFSEDVINQATTLSLDSVCLDWIDFDDDTRKFTEFWFAEPQRNDLRRLALLIFQGAETRKDRKYWNAFKLAVSRTIVTKEQKSSLARDTAHSRPHRVTLTNNYDVFEGVKKSVKQISRLLLTESEKGRATVRLGDARIMKCVKSNSVDAVVTSPPYLNAIDYLRGHKMSLVWFGYQVSDIRTLRGNSIGAEKSIDRKLSENVVRVAHATGQFDNHPKRTQGMILRYADDLYRQLGETSRVLIRGGKAIYVVGNSCLRNIYVENSQAVIEAATINGLKLVQEVEREIPSENRYLPIQVSDTSPLGKRMRTEVVLAFEKQASVDQP